MLVFGQTCLTRPWLAAAKFWLFQNCFFYWISFYEWKNEGIIFFHLWDRTFGSPPLNTSHVGKIIGVGNGDNVKTRTPFFQSWWECCHVASGMLWRKAKSCSDGELADYVPLLARCCSQSQRRKLFYFLWKPLWGYPAVYRCHCVKPSFKHI